MGGMVMRVIVVFEFEGIAPDSKEADQIIEEIDSGYFPGCPEYSDRDSEESDRILKEFEEKTGFRSMWDDGAKNHPLFPEYSVIYKKATDKEYKIEKKKRLAAARRYYDSVKHRLEGFKIYKLEYADDGGEAVLEHGDIFHKVPHVTISHH